MSKYPDGKYERHPLNVPGPFYVENEQCIACLLPVEKASELFGYFEDPPDARGCSHCYFKKQPSTPEEVELALEAIVESCCGALRYCGDDPLVLERLSQLGYASRCDELCEEHNSDRITC